MPRVTKSVTAKSKHKKILSSTKGNMAHGVDYIKQQSNLILNLSNTHSEIGKIEKYKSLVDC